MTNDTATKTNDTATKTNDTAAVENLLRDLVIANRALAVEGVIDDFGHVSARHPSRPDRFFLSRSGSPGLVTRDDLLEFTHEGDLVRPIRADCMRSASFTGRSISSVQTSIAWFITTPAPCCLSPRRAHGCGRYSTWLPSSATPYQHGTARTNSATPTCSSSSLPMGLSLARKLGSGRCVLLRGHGAVCAAESIAGACFVSIYLKENAEVILNTLPLSPKPEYLTAGEVSKTSAMLLGEMPLSRAWDYWKSRAGFAGL